MSDPSISEPQISPERRPPPRIANACERCRSRKVRCDGHIPCGRCRNGGDDCVFQPACPTRQRRRRHIQKENASSSQVPLPDSSPLPPLPSNPTVLHDPVQFKRQMELRAGIGVTSVETGSFQFYGPSSHFCFIQRMCQRINRTPNETLLTSRTSVPEGLRKWNLERFMFSVDANSPSTSLAEAFISREIGISLIHSFFEVIHPQMPILYYSDILAQWEDINSPPAQQASVKRKEVLFMVLAIGARVFIAEGEQKISVFKDWADYFSSKANRLHATFEDLSLTSTIFLLLKAMHAYQTMRANEAYLYLGHAARSAMALGINRQQVVNGTNSMVHCLKRTFWIIYSHERMSALYTGRPSSLRDDFIDASYPEDMPSTTPAETGAMDKFYHPTVSCGYIRGMAGIARVCDRVCLNIYSTKETSIISSLGQMRNVLAELETSLQSVTSKLPSDLHFFDSAMRIGEGWQEVQRLTLGCHYYFLRMLIYRPALIFSAFFDSHEEAQRGVGNSCNVELSVRETIKAASSIIDLTHDVYFRRYPRARFDGTSATLLVAACVTLLYDVLDPKTAKDHAKEVFTVVERGLECLGQIHHVGQTTGKAVSQDVMRIAKEALRSVTVDPDMSQNLFGEFPWLQYVSPPEYDFGNPFVGTSTPSIPQVPSTAPLASTNEELNAQTTSAPEANYISHWLEAGFAPEEIPSSLF